MKKPILKTIAILTSFAIVACSQDIVVENTQTVNDCDAINQICITGKDFQIDEDTRSSVSIGESGASFAWNEDDVIGIFPDKGDQVSFAMEQGAGTQTATFTGGGWALKSSAKYAAYYPHVYENRDMTAIPVSYIGQTQNGNGNTDYIGAYDYMAASVSTPENGAVAFDMQHLGALVQMTITVPEPSTLTKVVLTCSTEFTETGTIDLTADTPTINAATQSNTFEIALNNVTTTETNENVVVYLMIAPIDLTDSKLTSIIYFDDTPTRTAEFIGKKLQAGKAYKFSIENCQFLDYIDEYCENHGKGVEIDGVVWAPVNCGYHKNDFQYGKLYQWGRKYGQGYDGYYESSLDDTLWPYITEGPVDIVIGESQNNERRFYYSDSGDWSSSHRCDLWNARSEDNPIKTEYDPCPDGWRVPTYAELKMLMKNHSSGVSDDMGHNGYWFSGSNVYTDDVPQVFLWKAGYRRSSDGNAYSRGSYGYYWTSSSDSYNADVLCFYGSNHVYMSNEDFAYGLSVRCVQE